MRKFAWLFGKPEIAKPITIVSRPGALRWSAVSIVPGPHCCLAVRGLTHRRYLSAEAPRLPVPECNARPCECRFKHHTDRRAKVQRKRDRDEMSLGYKATERRSISRGRRESDY
jgi:hypothetical protein